MNNILKELYCGNLAPADRQMIKGSEIACSMEELTKAETVLEQSLTPELLPVLKRLTDAQITLNAITAEANYIDGSLKTMQSIAGGYIQAIYPFDDSVALVTNEVMS